MNWKGEQDKGNFLIQGDDIRIFVEGNYEKKYSHFGGVELFIKAIKEMVMSIDFKFAEENDVYARDKIMMELIDCIGERIKFDLSYDTDLPNSKLVVEFISWNS